MEDPGFFPIRKLAIVGLGLIGGSLAIDLRRLGLAAEILGYDSNPEHCTKAKELHLADHCNSVPDETLRDADWIVFAVPVQSTEKALDQFRPFLKPDILITDTVVLALVFLGGEIIHDFAFALLVGVLIGTYSSIYVASPTVLWLTKIAPPKTSD